MVYLTSRKGANDGKSELNSKRQENRKGSGFPSFPFPFVLGIDQGKPEKEEGEGDEFIEGVAFCLRLREEFEVATEDQDCGSN